MFFFVLFCFVFFGGWGRKHCEDCDELVVLFLSIPSPDSKPVLQVDLGFAISATDIGAEETFQYMKNVVKYVIDTHGISRMRYGVILFADSSITYIPLSQTFPDKSALTTLFDSYPRPQGEPDLRKALIEAKEMFDKAPAPPEAKQVLAVIMDQTSINDLNDVKKAAHVLEDDEIQIVPVGVGQNVEEEELESITGNKQNLIIVDKDSNPSDTGKEIVDKIVQGK